MILFDPSFLSQQWYKDGLPRDTFSCENGASVETLCRAHRWPFLIDPIGIAENWVTAKEGSALVIADIDMGEGFDSGIVKALEKGTCAKRLIFKGSHATTIDTQKGSS